MKIIIATGTHESENAFFIVLGDIFIALYGDEDEIEVGDASRWSARWQDEDTWIDCGWNRVEFYDTP